MAIETLRKGFSCEEGEALERVTRHCTLLFTRNDLFFVKSRISVHHVIGYVLVESR